VFDRYAAARERYLIELQRWEQQHAAQEAPTVTKNATEAPRDWRIPVGTDAEVSARYEPALAPSRGALFICAHGAGGHMADRGMLAVTHALRAHGLDVVRFNFVYSEQKSKRPDPMPRLQACIVAVAEHARRELAPPRLLLGGRSMGGRAASMLAAEGQPCDGLILLAYPLHPAGQPDKLRSAHLPKIAVPVLCFNGTRDALCTRELMDRAIAGLSYWTMHWVEGADHSFHVLKASGRSDAEVMSEIGASCAEWLAATQS
jgi:hypothetical protein